MFVYYQVNKRFPVCFEGYEPYNVHVGLLVLNIGHFLQLKTTCSSSSGDGTSNVHTLSSHAALCGSFIRLLNGITL